MAGPVLDCREIDRTELIERYVSGHATEEERDAFEVHYFDCVRCFDALQAYNAARDVLQNTPATLPAARPPGGKAGIWALAAAAVLLLASGIAVWRAAPPTVVQRAADPAPPPTTASPPAGVPDEIVARLARLDPLPSAPPMLRSSTQSPAFVRAMEEYRAGRFEPAAAALRSIAAPVPIQASFFLAICELQLGRTEDAVARLRAVIARGDTPYREEARLYLAKALIGNRDWDRAEAELQSVVEMRADREREAASLLAELRAARRPR